MVNAWDATIGDYTIPEASNTRVIGGKNLSATRVIAEKRSQLINTTSQTGVSATGDTGWIDVTSIQQLFIMCNLSAFTGTSIQFKLQTMDEFNNVFSIVSPTALTATGATLIHAGPGLSSNVDFAAKIRIQWACTAVTTATFTVTIRGK